MRVKFGKADLLQQWYGIAMAFPRGSILITLGRSWPRMRKLETLTGTVMIGRRFKRSEKKKQIGEEQRPA